MFAAGTLLTLYNFARSHFRGAKAPANPWEGDSLEWSTSSPPPEYNFAAMPVVAGRHPPWDETPTVEVAADAPSTRALGVSGALDKTMPVSEGLDAQPQHVLGIPSPTYLPFVTAVGVGVLFVGLLVQAVVVGAVGVLLGATAIVRWLWRTSEELS